MYQLDPQAARDADTIGAYLNETGKYIGQFTRAEKLVSHARGTHGIGFTFEAKDKRTTRFDIWTMRADGEHLSGYKAVNAIMACLKLRGLTESTAMVDRYDFDTKQTNKVQAPVFAELTGKPIGVLLRNTEYAKIDRDGRETGETGWRLEFVMPFQADTELTASEVLDRKTSPEKLASAVAFLQDRPLKNKPIAPARQQTHSAPAGNAGGGNGFDDMDDDIPF